MDGGLAAGSGALEDVVGSGSGLLFDANPVAMWVHDRQTLRIVAANEAAVRQYGWPRPQLLSMTVLDLLPPDDRPAFMEELLAGRPAGSTAGAARRRHYTRDGAVVAVEVQTGSVALAGRPATLVLARDVTEGVRGVDGQPVQMTGAARDVTPRREAAEALRLAVDSNQLRVVYQPIVHLGQATPSGVEALVRWQHPSRGLLTPAEFIPVAEETGLVVPLGAWVLRQACRDLTGILDGGGIGAAPPDLVMSVNLSARQLSMPSLVSMVERVLGEFGLPAGRLCFEITESVLIDDVDGAIPVLSELRALGVRLAIDDFGTGYSSLGYLRRLPVDIVKLDRAFVAGLGTDSAADAVAAAVINLGHALGLSVIAEGVENEEQLTVLRALGCDRAQGYLWSAPQAPAPLAEWMAAMPSGQLRLGRVDLAALVAERLRATRSTSTAPIVADVPPTLAHAFADPGAVRKVLDHLVRNALDYSFGDRPVVVSAAADRRFVRVSVADAGIGMTAEEAARCFEPFWQADQVSGGHPRRPASAGREPGGAGVGLYIVRSLVEAMGGHVAVRSAKGAGSTFTVALPRSAREAPRAGRLGTLPPGRGEDSSIRRLMRRIGVPRRSGSKPPRGGIGRNRP